MEFKTISTKELDSYVGMNNILIIDLRNYKEYKKGHIPSAVNIPYEHLEQHLSDFHKYSSIVLYCERGNISLLAARSLSSQGFNIINVCGGIRYYRGKLSIDG